VNDEQASQNLPPAFKPFIAAEVIKPEFASAIAQTTKVQDLLPAFKPFIASDAMKAINAKQRRALQSC
jgi:hypothetical protein